MWRRTDRATQTKLLRPVLLLLLLTTSVQASSGLLTGTLGRWLDTEAAPQIAELLSKHPKFSGEAVQIVALAGGKPVETPSRLHQAVQAHLTQRLLQYPGVRLAWQEPLQNCGVTEHPNYLLGIEFEPPAGTAQSLNLGMIDVEESVWVSGISLTWRGRLSSAEALALRTAVPGAATGTLERPLPLQDTARISEVLQRSLRCTLPEGVDGPVYLEPAGSEELSRLQRALQRDLTLAALAVMTPDPADARWRMAITANAIGPQTREVLLTLTDHRGELNQHLASVFVSSDSRAAPIPADSRVAANAISRVTTEPGQLPLLTAMQLHPRASGGVCGTHRGDPDSCIEVSFELTQDAYLFVLSTSQRELHSSSCSSQTTLDEAGERRFRLRLGRGRDSATPDAGVYAIAVADRAVARAVARHIRNAPGACSRHAKSGLNRWLTQLDALLAKHPGSYEWRAIHLANAGNQAVEI